MENLEIEPNFKCELTLKQMQLSNYFKGINLFKQYLQLVKTEARYLSKIIESTQI